MCALVAFNRWRKLTTFVYAQFPATCTDDLINRKLEHSGNYKAYVPSTPFPDDLNGYYFIKEKHYGTTLVSRIPVLYFKLYDIVCIVFRVD